MILYYTGTGNSEYVAKRLGQLLQESPVNLIRAIRAGENSRLYSEKPWVICTPTYAWRIPHVIEDWFSRSEFSGNKDVYFVLTCGDGVGKAGKYAERLCAKKGLNYKGLAKIVMPENYIAMFDAPDEKEAMKIVAAADPVIDQLASEILELKEIAEAGQLAGGFLSSVVNDAFYRFAIRDRKFTVSDQCIGCGLCESLCPMGNIEITDHKPKWNGNCTHCMACICHCPQKAIEYGKKSVGQVRYVCPK